MVLYLRVTVYSLSCFFDMSQYFFYLFSVMVYVFIIRSCIYSYVYLKLVSSVALV